MSSGVGFQLINGEDGNGTVLSDLCRCFLVCQSTGYARQVIAVSPLIGRLDQRDKQDETGSRQEIGRLPAKLTLVISEKHCCQRPCCSSVHGVSANGKSNKMHNKRDKKCKQCCLWNRCPTRRQPRQIWHCEHDSEVLVFRFAKPHHEDWLYQDWDNANSTTHRDNGCLSQDRECQEINRDQKGARGIEWFVSAYRKQDQRDVRQGEAYEREDHPGTGKVPAENKAES